MEQYFGLIILQFHPKPLKNLPKDFQMKKLSSLALLNQESASFWQFSIEKPRKIGSS